MRRPSPLPEATRLRAADGAVLRDWTPVDPATGAAVFAEPIDLPAGDYLVEIRRGRAVESRRQVLHEPLTVRRLVCQPLGAEGPAG